MQVHVISLARTPERLAEFRRRNDPAVACEVFAAVEGRDCAQQDLVRDGYFQGSIGFKPGAIGNALSHLTLWQAAAQGNAAVTICEDDAMFHRQFAERAEQAMAQLDGPWDFIAWGWNFDSILLTETRPNLGRCLLSFDQKAMRVLAEDYLRMPVRPNLFKLLKCFGTPAYTISPAGARTLLQKVLPIKPMDLYVPGINRTLPNTGLDVTLNHFYADLDCYVAFPPLVLTANDRASSTIQAQGSDGGSR